MFRFSLALAFLCVFALGCGGRRQLAWSGNPAYQAQVRAGHPRTGERYFAKEEVPPPNIIGDPFERPNRAIWAFNDALITYLLDPFERGYRWVMPVGARDALRRMADTFKFPIRFFNNLFQFDPGDSWTEAKRFGANFTLGIFGLFDVADSWFGVKAPEKEDFGRTLGKWGWSPKMYLTLPLFGPSNGRDFLGMIADMPFDISTYVAGSGVVFGINEFSYTVLLYNLVAATEHDPYAYTRLIWTVTRLTDKVDLSPGDPDDPALQTLGAAFLAPEDPDFHARGEVGLAPIASTGRELPYTYWLQPEGAPALVYVLPGLGGHRDATATVGLAEAIYKRGLSVVAVSSSMNWEFMENAASVPVPGYAPADSRDTRAALDAIDRDLRERRGGWIGEGRGVVGMSLGGIQTLLMAADAQADRSLIAFDRYVALNAPMDVLHAVEQIDAWYNAPLAWPAARREQKMREALAKVALLVRGAGASESDGEAESEEKGPKPPPLESTEAKYLIGLVYRMTLRDVIHSSQSRDNFGVLKTPLGSWKRAAAYDEIMEYSYMEYFHAFVLPYYQYLSPRPVSYEEIVRRSNLRAYGQALAASPGVRVFQNENDFLLSPADFDWMRQTFGTDEKRLVVLPSGGHLGGLFLPDVREVVLKPLDDLKR